MASIDIDTILQDLDKRFSAPLPEFHKRRIIFWYDEEEEFKEQLEDINLENAKLVVLNEKNNFQIKKLLCYDDKINNYLVYNPLSYDRFDDDWLINIKLYSEEFRADLISIWMTEMHITNTLVFRDQVKNYRKYFNAIDRRKKIMALNCDFSSPNQIPLAVMASICGNKNIQENKIIRKVISGGLDMETNEIYQSLVHYNADKAFWYVVAQVTGYNEGESCSIEGLAISILLTALSRTMKIEGFVDLKQFIHSSYQAYCYDFISHWIHSDDNNQIYEVARYVEEEAKLPKRIAEMDVDDLANTECFPCVNEVILQKLMTDISNQIITVDTITDIVEKRRTMVWYDKVACYYDGIFQVANMQQFFIDNSEGFHIVEAKNVWNKYTTEYYKMDAYYRQFHICFQKSLVNSNYLLDDLFKLVAEKVEGLYKHWFLDQLGDNWSNASEDDLENYGRIVDVPKQEYFYTNYVGSSNSRVIVIISDAFRYEVAASLTEQLRRETQCKVDLKSCCATFPTVTKFGMAALLPHRKLSVAERQNGTLQVLADERPTESTDRDKILKNANKESIALQYKNIIGMKGTERQALAKGMNVIYIYHDKVDEASHTSDSAVFPACEDAIMELKNLVRIAVNDFNGRHIYITADHGFLYTYSPLTEDDKVDKTTPSKDDVEIDRRYLITRKGAKPDYLMPVKFLGDDCKYDAFTPRQNVRIKKKGGGLNFVHGGASLQEIVVPIIDYNYLSTSSKAYRSNRKEYDTKPVTIQYYGSSNKLGNMLFSLNFYQKEPVCHNREAATFNIYFTDSYGNQISDTQKIIADKTSDNEHDRTFNCDFSLKPQKYINTEIYYLNIVDESGEQIPQREEFQIDIPFAFDEFNF